MFAPPGRRFLISGLLALLCHQAMDAGEAQPNPQGITLDATDARIGLNASSCAIDALAHRPTGRDMAAPAPSLYLIELVEPALWIKSQDAARIRALPQADGSIVVEAAHTGAAELNVTCRLRAEAGCVLGSIAVKSPRPVRLGSVNFPLVSLCLPFSGDGSTDAVVLPYCDGAIAVNPLVNGLSQFLTYPEAGSMQFLAAYGQAEGVFLSCRDSKGFAKMFTAVKRDQVADLSVRHILSREPTTSWSLPYDIAITTFGVEPKSYGWETAADLYGAWARKQPWCARTLKQRVDSGEVPRWLTQPSLFYAFTLRGRRPDGTDGVRVSLAPDHADAWRKVVGGPVTFMLMSWEKHGPWVAPDYFPPLDDGNAFKAATRLLRGRKHHTLAFLSGLNWTLRKTDRGYQGKAIDNQAAFDQKGRASAICDAAGEPSINGKPDQDIGQFARLCTAMPLTGQMLREAVRQCQQYGIDCVQLDQVCGGGVPACFHPGHGHPIGGGNWSAQMAYKLYEGIRAEAKTRDANFAFSVEEPCEFFIPVLDTCHARDYIQNSWPRAQKGLVGVPLFTHVYHDYLHAYGGDSANVSAQANAVALYHQGMNLVCGKAPAVATWTQLLDPATVDSAQKRLLRGHFDLWRGPAGEFLLYGRRLAAKDLDAPLRQVTFTSWPQNDKRIMDVPAVLHSVWELPDGRRCRVMACIALEPVSVSITGKSRKFQPGETVYEMLAKSAPP